MKAQQVLGLGVRETVPAHSSGDVLDEAVQIVSGENQKAPTRAHLACLAIQNDILRDEVTILRRALLLRVLQEAEFEEFDSTPSGKPREWMN